MSDSERSVGGALLTASLCGALLGSMTVVWLLLVEQRRCRAASRQRRMLHMPRMVNTSIDSDRPEAGIGVTGAIEDRMDRIYEAIKEVREQLETMGDDRRMTRELT